MEKDFLIDTNVFIDLMSGRFSEPIRKELHLIMSSSFFISVVNKIEILGFQHLDPQEETLFNSIINSSKMIYVHDGVIEETILLRKTLRMKLADAIIAASCISVNAVLLTTNTTDFKKISNLRVVNPLQLI